MSRLISDILNASEPHFSHKIASWEQKTGRTGHDIRLISDITQKRKRSIEALRLDQADTTSRELYYALRHRAIETNVQLEQTIGITVDNTPSEVLGKVIAFVDDLRIPRDVWIVKHSVIKQLLKNHPPKKLLKVLGLRSIDSVLKRSNSYQLLAMAYQIESPEWIAKVRQQFKKLKPTDFQISQSTLYEIEPAKVAKLRKAGYSGSRLLIPNYETGTVSLMASDKRFPLDTLALTLSILQSLYDARVYSAYFRHISVRGGFGLKFSQALTDGLPGKAQQTEIGWKILQQYFNRKPESFDRHEQPQLQFEDVRLVTPTVALSERVPTAEFWADTTYTFAYDQRPVSMHLMDVVINASNNVAYEHSSYSHLQGQLWEELGQRYLAHDVINAEVLLSLGGNDDGDIELMIL